MSTQQQAFNAVSPPPVKPPAPARKKYYRGKKKPYRRRYKKRMAPFSLRLTVEERAELERLARGMSLSGYIKACIFNSAGTVPKRWSRQPVADEKMLGQLLGALGATRLPQNMNQLAKAAHVGNLPLQDTVEGALIEACEDIKAMRLMLMQGLGMRIPDESRALVRKYVSDHDGGAEQ